MLIGMTGSMLWIFTYGTSFVMSKLVLRMLSVLFVSAIHGSFVGLDVRGLFSYFHVMSLCVWAKLPDLWMNEYEQSSNNTFFLPMMNRTSNNCRLCFNHLLLALKQMTFKPLTVKIKQLYGNIMIIWPSSVVTKGSTIYKWLLLTTR